MKINNLKELEGRGELKEGDQVYFTVGEKIIVYHVNRWFLRNTDQSDRNNSAVFDLLKLDDNAKYKLASKAYGCKVTDGYWPINYANGYPALTRLVKELYKIIEEKYPKEVYTPITSRFDILDL